MSRSHTASCEHCDKPFAWYLIGNGMNGSFHAFCEQCGNTIVTESLVDPQDIDFLPCTCGGKVSYDASPRCPHCLQPLSAKLAARYIEAVSPGVARGWLWQRRWNGGDAFVIEGKLLYNHPWTRKPGFRWWRRLKARWSG